jgi:hypothetical protein
MTTYGSTFHLERNILYRQSSLTSNLLSHVIIGQFPAGSEDLRSYVAARQVPCQVTFCLVALTVYGGLSARIWSSRYDTGALLQ